MNVKKDLIKTWGIDESWTLFLDRDGVINHETFENYITKPEEFKFLEGVQDAIAFLSNIFTKIIVVTNQQGVGKGIMSENDLIEVNDYMHEQIKIKGGRLDAIYYATELSGTKGGLRKPGRGMVDLAKKNFPEIDFEKSIIIGNSSSDIELGNHLGMKTIYIGKNWHRNALYTLESLKMFTQLLSC